MLLTTVLLVVIAAAFCALRWVRRNTVLVTVAGHSMEPTLRDGDRVLVRRRKVTQLKLADIVVLDPPGTVVEAGAVQRSPSAGLQVKRLVGLPGQPVPPRMRAAVKSDRVPAGTVLVLSDNLRHGLDSRVWGPYPAGGVVGVVLFGQWFDSGGTRWPGCRS
ncbi:S26 family signal peptidase [Nonomuraea sp. KM90]|uniref:S26 family signal peptidase n=1 Tax=Nonomuraea sp. KM90 TaxID=3457428 RepID=UPI003FCD4530